MQLEAALAEFSGGEVPVGQIAREVAVQYPRLEGLSFGTHVQARRNVSDPAQDFALDTVPLIVVTWEPGRSSAQRVRDQQLLSEWLRVRLQLDTLEVISR